MIPRTIIVEYERLKKTIVEFLVSELRTSGKLSPLSYWDYRLAPLDVLLMNHEELMRLPYEELKNKVCGLSFIKKEDNLYYSIRTFCKSFLSYCYYADSVEDKFNRDIWLLDEYPISSNRFNKTAAAKTIRFDRIADQKNKYMVKKYIEYRIYETS